MGILESKSSFLILLILFISSLGDDHFHGLVGFRGASAASSIVVENGKAPYNRTFWESVSGGSLDGFDGGDLLRHYAAGGRWLLQSGQKITYRALQSGPVCSTNKYSKCIVPGGGGRECSDYNRCKRAPDS